MNWKNTSSLMKIIAEELLSERKQGKATEEQCGDLTFKPHEISTMWRTLSSIKTIDRAQEVATHQEEEEGEEDPRKFKTMIQEIRTSIANIMEEDTTPKRAQKTRKI
jgi:ribosomal protein L29